MDGYSPVLDDIHVGCSSCSQNRHPQNGADIPNWLLRGGQSFLCFTFQLEGARGIPKAAHVFLESSIGCLKMIDLNIFVYNPNFKSLSKHIFFCLGW
jgi:hypothetical protein